MQGKHAVLGCPFCPAKIWAPSDEDVPYVKAWMGKHLARLHQDQTKLALKVIQKRDSKPAGFARGL